MKKTKAVSFKKVNKYYNKFHALKNISFDIPKNTLKWSLPSLPWYLN